METQFVSRAVFNPAVGAHYAKLVKKNRDAFDLEHWVHTRSAPFPPSPLLPPLPLFPTSQEFRGTRTDSLMSSSWYCPVVPVLIGGVGLRTRKLLPPSPSGVGRGYMSTNHSTRLALNEAGLSNERKKMQGNFKIRFGENGRKDEGGVVRG